MRNFWNSRAVRWGLVVGWMAAIFYLSAQPTLPNLTPGAPGVEEVGGHFMAFAILSWLLWQALDAEGVRYPAVWAVLIALLYGISDEFHQSFVPGRDPSIKDWGVDAVGAVVGLSVAVVLKASNVKRQTSLSLEEECSEKRRA